MLCDIICAIKCVDYVRTFGLDYVLHYVPICVQYVCIMYTLARVHWCAYYVLGYMRIVCVCCLYYVQGYGRDYVTICSSKYYVHNYVRIHPE